MSKYFTSISFHCYVAMFFSIITVLLAEDASFKMVGAGILICLPLWYSYYKRVKDMSSEEISKAFGFYGNKFLDCTEE